MFLMEKSFSYTIFDLLFPYHMYLGYFEKLNKQTAHPSKEQSNLEEGVHREDLDY